jgi:hypothetical protein
MHTIKDLFNGINDRDINLIKNILLSEDVNPSKNDNYAIVSASSGGRYDIAQLLIKDSRVDPTGMNNLSIYMAYTNQDDRIVDLLWSDQRVKNTLINNYPNLYNSLRKNELKIKIGDF